MNGGSFWFFCKTQSCNDYSVYVDPGQFGMKFSSHGGTGTGIHLKTSEFVLYFVVL